MSLYLKTTLFGGGRRLFRVRTLSATVGENSLGVLTLDQCTTSFFSLYCFYSRFYLESRQPLLRLNLAVPPLGRLTLIKTGDVIQLEDYRMTVIVTTGMAEVLADQEVHGAAPLRVKDRWPSFRFALAGLEKILPLPPFRCYTVSTSETAAVHLDPLIFGDFQMFLRVEPDQVTVHPSIGQIKLNGASLSTATAICSNARLELTRSSLPVWISW